MGDSNGWGEWSKHVLIELERLNNNMEALRQDFQESKLDNAKEIAALKSRMIVVSASLGALGAFLITILKHFVIG